MTRDALARALRAASPAARLRALAPLLPAVDEALAALPPGMGMGHGAATAALVDAWARGEAIAGEALAAEVQSTAFCQRDLGEDAHTRGGALEASLLLGHVALVQAALVDVLGLDMVELLTRPVADPDDEEHAPIALFDRDEVEDGPPQAELFVALLEGSIDALDAHEPLRRALVEVARRLPG